MYRTIINGKELSLETDDKVFSPSSADRGTLAMLSVVELFAEDKVLDLGCGCGIVGIYAAMLIGADKITMCDIAENAVKLSAKNAALNCVEGVRIIKSDGLSEIADRDFTVILSNPPYHTNFSVAKGFIENGFAALATGGRMIMVTKRLEWYKNKLTSVFGGVKVHEIDGYYVFCAEKRSNKKPTRVKKPPVLSAKLQRKQDKRSKKTDK